MHALARFLGLGALSLVVIAASAPIQDESLADTVALPASKHAAVDETEAGVSRPALHILADGRVVAGEEVLFDPAARDEVARLHAWLRDAAKEMEQEPVEVAGVEHQLSAGELRLHADRSAPFDSVQRVLVQCGTDDVWIWKLQLAVERAPAEEDASPGYLAFRLPVDWPVKLQASNLLETYVTVIPRVLNPGTRFARATGEPWKGASDGIFEPGPGRRLEYQLGASKTPALDELGKHLAAIHEQSPEWPLVIDPRAGVVVAEVVALIDVALGAGFERYAFFGPRD